VGWCKQALLGAAMLTPWSTHSAEAVKAWPLPSAFGTPPKTQNVQLSPNGELIAWFDLSTTPQTIIVFDLARHKDVEVLQIPADTKLRSLVWSDSGTLLFTASAARRDFDASQLFEMSRIFSVDVKSGKMQALLNHTASQEFVSGAILLKSHVNRPKIVVLSTPDFNNADRRMSTGTRLGNERRDSGWVQALFEVDTSSGMGTRIDEGTPYTDQWVVGPDGKALGRSEWDAKNNDFSVFAKRGLGWSKIYHRADGQRLVLAGVTSDSRSIVALGLDHDGRSKVFALPLDGSVAEVIYEDSARNVTNVVLDDKDETLVGVDLDGADSQRVWLDPVMHRRIQSLSNKFAGQDVRIESRSADNTRLVARVSSPDKAPLYFLIDYTAHTADIIGEEYPALADVKLGKVSVISFKARDGVDIPAYLTTPPGYVTGTPLPLVVLPHGGPAARDHFTFDWLAQFIASRGYLVLQPQFRGSTGFGQDFEKAGRREWGGRMQNDVTDGVKAMLDEKFADPKRICIVGASYGGYAALAGAALTPDLYKCAVSIGGVSDLPAMQSWEERRSSAQSDAALYWRDNIGSPLDPKVVAASPNRRAASIVANVLLIHASDDTVVPVEQSEMMATTLRAGNKSVTVVKLPGQDHWLSESKMRVETLKQLDAFLQANLTEH
jgi:dipeptidyl aminopeptidase/acylaminoacyl peptidase